MKCQSLFYGKNKKKMSSGDMLSVNVPADDQCLWVYTLFKSANVTWNTMDIKGQQ